MLSVRCRTEAADLDLSLMSGGGTRGPWLDSRVREQAIGFSLDHRVALAAQPFQRGPVQDRDVSAAVVDHPEPLQLADRRSHAFTADAEHVGDEFMGHRQFAGRQAVQRHEQPAARLLVDRVPPPA